MSEQAMFRERADLYDRIYHWKDYAAESARIRGLLDAAGVADGARVVEGACGTGAYLVHLAKHYQVSGFDLNQGVLDVARRKLPDTPLFRADLADFNLDAPADVLLCLFGSIGYLDPVRDLPRAAACFFRALRPGGIALVEPWFSPAEFHAGTPSVQTYDGATAKPPETMRLVRATVGRAEGARSVFDFHWLVLTPSGAEHFVDRHALWMATEDEFLAPWRAAGFACRWLSPGPVSGRTLVVARRPA